MDLSAEEQGRSSLDEARSPILDHDRGVDGNGPIAGDQSKDEHQFQKAISAWRSSLTACAKWRT